MSLKCSVAIDTGGESLGLEKERFILKTLDHVNIQTMFSDFICEIADEVVKTLPTEDLRNAAFKRNFITGRNVRSDARFYTTSFFNPDQALSSTMRSFTGAPPLAFQMRVLLQVGNALLHCMSRNVVHLDVKPENIFINGGTNSPQAVLCGFGCAVQLDDDTLEERFKRDSSNPPKGSKSGHAPEILNAMTKRLPISFKKQPSFELGVLGYNLMLGEHPVKNYYTLGSKADVIYRDDEINKIDAKFCPSEPLQVLLQSLVKCKPGARPDLADAVAKLSELVEGLDA